MDKGSSILEVLIAITILTLGISAAVMVVFGNQSLKIDNETNSEALYKTKSVLERARASSTIDFLSVASTTFTSSIYTQTLAVSDLTPCRKEATSTITWSVSPTRTQKIELTSNFTDIAAAFAMGGDCDSNPPGDWDNPITTTSVGIGGQGATDIDVRNKTIYLTSDPSAAAKEDFFVYEFNPTPPSLIELGKINVSGGLNDVDAIDDYAFTANTETSRHLMVFDVSNPTNPNIIASSSLPNMSVGVGRSIYYYNNKIYIGTQYLACPSCPPAQNNEFHIYDVSNPASPDWKGSFKVNHNINDIVVRDNYAYLATSDNNGEVRIYDISNPVSITFKGLFDASGNEDGETLYLLGNKLYLGRDRTPAARRDFYILNISDPANPIELGSKNLGLNPGTVVMGIVVKNNLAFIGLDNPTSGLQILNISNPSNIVNHPTCTSLNFAENTVSIDMENDSVFTANASNNEIRVIQDQASVCL